MVKKTYRRFSKKGLSKKNKLRKSKRKSLRSKRKSRKHGGDEGSSSGPKITKRYLTYGHTGCDTTNKFQYFLCELAKYYYYKMKKDTTREDAHKQKLIEMGIPEENLDQFYNEVTAEDTADVIKQKLLIGFNTIGILKDFISYESHNETKDKIRQGWSMSPSPIKVSI